MSDQRQQPSAGPSLRYRVGEQLAVGGMGTIHRAFDTLGQREVAYKRLMVKREENRPRMIALFRREYETLVALSHPNTVEVYDYGFDEQGPYYAMELLSGRDLTDSAPLPWREACRVLRDVASALALVHARRLVHRDVSPNNVRVTDDGTAKLLDFGALSSFGRPSEVMGTPAFMAPEALEGEPLDARTDLFSLGALAYWALTGRMCFPVAGTHELWDAWKAPVPPPSSFAADVPDGLDELVLSLLQHAQAARPPTAAHVIERLTALANLAPERDEREIARVYLQRPPLVERDEALAPLRAALTRTREGSGALALLEAEPGLGRSALLARLAIDAQLAGLTVLRGEGGEGLVPYALAERLVREAAHSYPEQADGIATENEADDGRAKSTIDVAEQRAKHGEQLRTRLTAFSRLGPLALLVDEAHRIDRDSLALLASLGDDAAQRPLFVLISLGGDEEALDPLVRATLERGATVRTKLAPLSEQGLSELVQTAFGDVPGVPRLARVLARESGGNPGVAMDLLAQLVRRGAIRYAGGTFHLPTDNVDVSVLEPLRAADAKLAEESPEARLLVHLLALHDGALTITNLIHASTLGAPEALPALERLVRRGIVIESDRRYYVGSDLLRASVVRGIDAEERSRLHAALADAIAAESDRSFPTEVAIGRHLMESGGERALRGARQIAEASRARGNEAPAFTPMVPFLEQALAVYRANGYSDDACLDLLVPLSFLGFFGDLAAQRRHLEPTLRALAERTGFGFAQRQRARLGAKLAVVVGLTWGALRAMFRRAYSLKLFAADVERFCMVAATAAAAAASVSDDREAYEAVQWLEPAATLPPKNPIALTYQFALATAEIPAGKRRAAAARFERLMELSREPVPGMDADRQVQFYYGSVHGLAQIAAEHGDARALSLASELDRSPFYMPYAETVRVGYAASRGDYEALEHARARAETLALRGGVAWSALIILILRCLYAYVQTGDSVGLARVVAELEPFKHASRRLERYAALASAHLDALRGEHERAIAAYEQLLVDNADHHLTYALDCSMFAWSLSARGEHARAKAVCERVLYARAGGELAERDARILAVRLALAETALGNHDEAATLLDEQLRRVVGDNPLDGLLHCERAAVALASGDLAGFERHAAMAEPPLRASKNPFLIAQYETLIARAARAGHGARALSSPPAAEEDSLDDLGDTYIEPANDTSAAPSQRPSTRTRS